MHIQPEETKGQKKKKKKKKKRAMEGPRLPMKPAARRLTEWKWQAREAEQEWVRAVITSTVQVNPPAVTAGPLQRP
ncbi:hypothetical protein EYF80_045487 [Liparis tanakae]|uniref:Uncharacterized protein n=1 Tax=Liparis tanakae TaxID=230148 RepID=A0A4Z2FUJ1_9TELE|nr:hypothetical protein EYF80_045487 [Liparis tanakae]